ncbi:CRE-HCP-4 protein [Ditylenchus destructor]|nr:CRE-HCP-4 protein [Ditylenchus destructor]
MTLSPYRMPGSSERRSRFRTKRISLKPCQVCAYYGLCESDEEGEEVLMVSTTKQTRDSDQTTCVPPSFRCSLPVSDFQSTASEDASFDNQTESLENDMVDRTKAKQNRDSDQTTFVPPSFRCSLPASDFQSSVSEDASFDSRMENLENDIVDRTKAKQNRDSDQTTFVPPSFRCSLPVSHFQSTVREDTSIENQSESLENDTVDCTKAKQNRDSDQTTFVPPSFRCSLPASHFQSTVYEDASFDNQTESLENDVVVRTKAKQNRESDQTALVAPSFRCSLSANHLQSTATQTENLENDIMDRTKAKQNRESDQTTFVGPSFRFSFPASHFQSTKMCEEHASFDSQTESLEIDTKHSAFSRSDDISLPAQNENEKAQLPMDDGVITSDDESPPRQENIARYSIIVPPPRPALVDPIAEVKPWRMEAKTLSIGPGIPRRTNEHSAEQNNNSFGKRPTEYTAQNSIPSPVKTTKRQFERKIASPLDNETIASSKPKDSLREIQLNYVTPTLAPRRRKSVFFSEFNTTYVYSDDKQGHFHISGADSFEYSKNSKVDEMVDHPLAEDVENIRLGENSINNLSGSRGPLMMGESLMDSTVLIDADETNVNESIVFGWQKKEEKTDEKELPKSDCNQPGTSKQFQQFTTLADSSMWDAGGVDDPSFYDNTVQFNDIEPSILDDSLPPTQQSRRCPEWPTVVDNSLGMSNSPASSNGHESYTMFGSQADSDNAFGAQMDSTILYGSQLESDDSLDSPKIKHIVIRASPEKKPRQYELAEPKCQRNDPASPSIAEYGLRRSDRNRIPRLDPGHLQKPIYKRDEHGNSTLVGVNKPIVNDKLLTKHRTADPKIAFESERQMKHRKKLEREKRKCVKELGQKLHL